MANTLDCDEHGDQAEQGDHHHQGDQPGLAQVQGVHHHPLHVGSAGCRVRREAEAGAQRARDGSAGRGAVHDGQRGDVQLVEVNGQAAVAVGYRGQGMADPFAGHILEL